ncbi:probable 2-oxoglutarate-dependent dioxygenase AOP1.2 isoform X2 [Gossypium arboreum]|uniref:probable 2-oxoglutarate-dependent dioxygenase AOP1.2 isoform X2 n=1 Tax=Gossypium arboreum TaxID=29729 RepID=UPI0022F14FF1|nr:probable 2-oxoglutarate-dependent dioxygenase AOP1.2 isoform X2 [Gossypium arboreum]
MDSQSPLKLPVIDFTKPELKPGIPEWDLAKGQVQQALQHYGCFEALFDKIPLEIREAVFGAMEELFDLPLHIKSRNVSEIPYHGYIGQHPKIPLFESIGFDDADVIEKAEAQTRTFWPQGNPSFSKTIQSFTKQLTELDQMIRRMILESFQVEKYVDEHMDSTGYLLKAWLNGRLKATYHRVMMSGDKPRYSLGLFTVPKAGYMIKAPEELVDEAHPLLYNPFDYAQFLGFYFSNEGRYQSGLKAYCGVQH